MLTCSDGGTAVKGCDETGVHPAGRVAWEEVVSGVGGPAFALAADGSHFDRLGGVGRASRPVGCPFDERLAAPAPRGSAKTLALVFSVLVLAS